MKLGIDLDSLIADIAKADGISPDDPKLDDLKHALANPGPCEKCGWSHRLSAGCAPVHAKQVAATLTFEEPPKKKRRKK